MLTYQDCVELSNLTEDEIDAIARHERLPEMAALEMVSYPVHTREGVPMIKRIILEDIEEARRHEHPDRALKLKFSDKTFRENPSEEPGRSVRKSELSQ